MQPLILGKIRVTRVVEAEGPTPPRFLFPEITSEELHPHREWLAPHFYDPAREQLLSSIQSFIVRTPHHTILVDTCVGNDKRRAVPNWNMRNGPFLADLAAAGVTPQQVDLVMCTHLHVDHVGWNTRLVNGRWEPTFPHARYVFSRREYEHWARSEAEETVDMLRDSVLPVLEAGLAVLVEDEHCLTDGVTLEPTPGHTPGHCSVRLASQGAEGVITGDMLHHPLQMLEPERCSRFCADPPLARRTRRDFLARYAERDARVLGTHFATPVYGRVVSNGDGFAFRV